MSSLVQDVATVLERRVREVVLHHTHLATGFSIEQWPDDLVAELLAETTATHGSRADHHALVGWLTGQAGPPGLAAWS